MPFYNFFASKDDIIRLLEECQKQGIVLLKSTWDFKVEPLCGSTDDVFNEPKISYVIFSNRAIDQKFDGWIEYEDNIHPLPRFTLQRDLEEFLTIYRLFYGDKTDPISWEIGKKLSKVVRQSSERGMTAVSTKTGNTTKEPSFRYFPGAKESFLSGVKLKQAIEANTEFVPDECL